MINKLFQQKCTGANNTQSTATPCFAMGRPRSGSPLGLRVTRVQIKFQKIKKSSDVVKKNLTARKRLRRENRR